MRTILNIGHCENKYIAGRTGGVVVLFEIWIEYCKEHGLDFDIIDVNKRNYHGGTISAYFSIFWQIVTKMRSCDTVFLHGTYRDYLLFAPLLVWLAKRLGKRMVMRKFAGNFADLYNKSYPLSRALMRYALKNADVLCWETKALVAFGKKFNRNSYWFPNVRKDMGVRRGDRPYQRRLLFLSRVEKEKGIFTLIEAMKLLDNSYHLKIYGPLSGIEPDELHGENYSYYGSVPSSDVSKTIADNDILILPTTWKAEGYPGVIIEAYSVGVPVISTPLGGIPEIMCNGKTGFFIPVNDANALAETIRRFNEDNYHQYSASAFNAFANFDYEKTNSIIAGLL